MRSFVAVIPLRLPAFIALRRDKLLPSATLVIQEINSNKKSFSV